MAAIDGLPNVAHDYAIAKETGADDIALMLLRTGMPEEAVLELVRAWVAIQRRGWIEVLEEELDPPFGAPTWLIATCLPLRGRTRRHLRGLR